MFGVVSLTMGNSVFPFGYGFITDTDLITEIFLRESFGFSGLLYKFTNLIL